MARTHARLMASIWSDPEWTALSAGAQRLYFLLLSQPKLSLVGVLDYMPDRWATKCADTTSAEIRACVAELAAARFVVVDEDTNEVLIRTFVKHDVMAGSPNVNLVKGLWSAWRGTESAWLRHLVVAELPEPAWTHDRCPPPPEAASLRGQTPCSPPLKRPVETARSDGPSEQPVATSLDLSCLPLSSSTAAASEVFTPFTPRAPDDDEIEVEVNRRVQEAVEAGRCRNPVAYRAKVLEDVRATWRPERRPVPRDAAEVIAEMNLPEQADPMPTELRRGLRSAS